jgi:hypothetical protein
LLAEGSSPTGIGIGGNTAFYKGRPHFASTVSNIEYKPKPLALSSLPTKLLEEDLSSSDEEQHDSHKQSELIKHERFEGTESFSDPHHPLSHLDSTTSKHNKAFSVGNFPPAKLPFRNV